MLEVAAGTGYDSTSRLLRPGALLRRYRPAHLNRVRQQMRFLFREAHGLKLIQMYFPESLVDIDSDFSWFDILRQLIRLAEVEGWFEPDWETLDDMWEIYMQMGDDDPADAVESEMLLGMAHFVEHIPVRHYNYGEEDWFNMIVENVPLLALVRGLVDPRFEANISNLLIEYELYDFASQDIDLVGLPRRCEGQPQPLCWLPEMVQFCRRETGNKLLDRCVGIIDWEFPGWRWDSESDLAEVKQLSAEAQPRWRKIEDLLAWADGPEQVEEAVCLLMGVDRGEVSEERGETDGN